MKKVTSSGSTPPAAAVALVGSATIAVSFGFARYGYGLFVPTFRREFGLTTSGIGLVGSAGYVAYLVGLLGSGRLTRRSGPRLPVLLGCAAAAGGSALIASASGVLQFGVGVVLAASAPGWAWAPFADAVAAVVERPLRRRVTAVVSTGTTFGLIVAGPLALLSSGAAGWRESWAVFAALAGVAGLGDLWVLPSSRTPGKSPGWSKPLGLRPRPGELPLLGQAVAYGAVASVYYTYAVDMVQAAGLGTSWSALLWTLVGLGGISGVATGDVVARIGLRPALGIGLAVLGAAVALLAAAPSSALLAGAAALAFGFAYMPLAALLALWSGEVHPDAPTAGFTRVLTAMAAGSILGPAALGPLASTMGLRTVFVLIAALAILSLRLRPSAAQPLVSTTRNLASPDSMRS